MDVLKLEGPEKAANGYEVSVDRVEEDDLGPGMLETGDWRGVGLLPVADAGE